MKGKIYKKIVIYLIFIIAMQIFFPLTFNLKVQANQDETITENSEYSELYKSYLKLSDEEKQKYEVIPRKYDITIEEFEDKTETENNEKTTTETNFFRKIFKAFAKADETETIPASYDLRKSNPNNLAGHGNIEIEVENQGKEPLCWTFASLGAIRTHLAVKGYNNNKTPNLSELHMNYIQSNLFGKDRKLQEGGRFYEFVPYLLNNNGPILEEKLPYNTKIDTSSEEELAKISSYEPDYYVHKIVEFPSVFKMRQANGTTKMYNNSTSIDKNKMTEIRNKIKTHIINNGGIYSFIRWDSNFMGYRIGGEYSGIDGQFAQYDDGSIAESEDYHTVTIIGWDDNYDKNKINAKNSKGEIVHPSENGAYLVLNSWGEEWGENGYFWISYEDSFVEEGLIGFLDVNETEKLETYTFESESLYKKIKEYCQKYTFAYETDDSSKTIKLTDLSLYFIGYSDFFEIMSLEKFSELDLSNCDISDNDLKELLKNDLPNLQKLNLSGNNITDVTPINNLTNLKEIDLSNNFIKDTSALDMTKYKKIDLSGQRQKSKRGDVDGNGTINLVDILKLRRYIANQTKWNLTDEEKERADVNEDEKINLSDVLKLRRYIAASSNESIKAKHSDWIWEE